MCYPNNLFSTTVIYVLEGGKCIRDITIYIIKENETSTLEIEIFKNIY